MTYGLTPFGGRAVTYWGYSLFLGITAMPGGQVVEIRSRIWVASCDTRGCNTIVVSRHHCVPLFHLVCTTHDIIPFIFWNCERRVFSFLTITSKSRIDRETIVEYPEAWCKWICLLCFTNTKPSFSRALIALVVPLHIVFTLHCLWAGSITRPHFSLLLRRPKSFLLVTNEPQIQNRYCVHTWIGLGWTECIRSCRYVKTWTPWQSRQKLVNDDGGPWKHSIPCFDDKILT